MAQRLGDQRYGLKLLAEIRKRDGVWARVHHGLPIAVREQCGREAGPPEAAGRMRANLPQRSPGHLRHERDTRLYSALVSTRRWRVSLWRSTRAEIARMPASMASEAFFLVAV